MDRFQTQYWVNKMILEYVSYGTNFMSIKQYCILLIDAYKVREHGEY